MRGSKLRALMRAVNMQSADLGDFLQITMRPYRVSRMAAGLVVSAPPNLGILWRLPFPRHVNACDFQTRRVCGCISPISRLCNCSMIRQMGVQPISPLPNRTANFYGFLIFRVVGIAVRLNRRNLK